MPSRSPLMTCALLLGGAGGAAYSSYHSEARESHITRCPHLGAVTKYMPCTINKGLASVVAHRLLREAGASKFDMLSSSSR